MFLALSVFSLLISDPICLTAISKSRWRKNHTNIIVRFERSFRPFVWQELKAAAEITESNDCQEKTVNDAE